MFPRTRREVALAYARVRNLFERDPIQRIVRLTMAELRHPMVLSPAERMDRMLDAHFHITVRLRRALGQHVGVDLRVKRIDVNAGTAWMAGTITDRRPVDHIVVDLDLGA